MSQVKNMFFLFAALRIPSDYIEQVLMEQESGSMEGFGFIIGIGLVFFTIMLLLKLPRKNDPEIKHFLIIIYLISLIIVSYILLGMNIDSATGFQEPIIYIAGYRINLIEFLGLVLLLGTGLISRLLERDAAKVFLPLCLLTALAVMILYIFFRNSVSQENIKPELQLIFFAQETVFLYTIVTAILLYIVLRKTTWKFSDLGIKYKNIFKGIVTGVCGGIFIWIISFGIEKIFSIFYTQTQETWIYDAIRGNQSIPALVVFILVAVLYVPVVEELFFRGFFYQVVAKRYGFLWALGISSVFFAMLHLDLSAFPSLLFVGAGFALLLTKTGTLVSCICAHLIFNTISLLAVMYGG